MNDDPGFVYTNCQVCGRTLRDEHEYEMGMCLPCACQVMGPFPPGRVICDGHPEPTECGGVYGVVFQFTILPLTEVPSCCLPNDPGSLAEDRGQL